MPSPPPIDLMRPSGPFGDMGGIFVEGGEREEFWISGSEYGLTAEGDDGTLVSQGTEIRSFTRLTQTE